MQADQQPTSQQPTSQPPSPMPEPAADGRDVSPAIGLYGLPALIVLVFAAGWLGVFSIFHEQHDPQSLVQRMQQPGRRSWQSAYALSQLLLDPQHDHLKDDEQLCRTLATILADRNEQARQWHEQGRSPDEQRARFRAFLCRALGQFRRPEALGPLLQCAAFDTSKLPAGNPEHEVRRASMEAIAMLSAQLDRPTLQAQSDVVDILVAATREETPPGAESDVASAATFALGVVGGAQATDHLSQLVADARPDVRYNAATGLARQGRPEAVAVLLEMLDPHNRITSQQETTAAARDRKQTMVLTSALQATAQLLPAISADQRPLLLNSLEHLVQTPTTAPRARMDAKRILRAHSATPP